jgi:hypothetical protein
MLRPPTVALPLLLAGALSATGCDYVIPSARGECTGTHLGRRVSWPIEEQSLLVHQGPGPDGAQRAVITLFYTPEDTPELDGFGVDIHLAGDARVSRERTVTLLPSGHQLVPAETSLVERWVGNIGGATGYLSVPGVPQEGQVTLTEVSTVFAEGRFVYRYAERDQLTCTFEVADALPEE